MDCLNIFRLVDQTPAEPSRGPKIDQDRLWREVDGEETSMILILCANGLYWRNTRRVRARSDQCQACNDYQWQGCLKRAEAEEAKHNAQVHEKEGK